MCEIHLSRCTCCRHVVSCKPTPCPKVVQAQQTCGDRTKVEHESGRCARCHKTRHRWKALARRKARRAAARTARGADKIRGRPARENITACWRRTRTFFTRNLSRLRSRCARKSHVRERNDYRPSSKKGLLTKSQEQLQAGLPVGRPLGDANSEQFSDSRLVPLRPAPDAASESGSQVDCSEDSLCSEEEFFFGVAEDLERLLRIHDARLA